MKPEILKLLEENIGNELFDIGLNNIFLDMFPLARATKAKISRTTSNTVKETINTMKRQTTEWENIFAKGLISNIYKKLMPSWCS